VMHSLSSPETMNMFVRIFKYKISKIFYVKPSISLEVMFNCENKAIKKIV